MFRQTALLASRRPWWPQDYQLQLQALPGEALRMAGQDFLQATPPEAHCLPPALQAPPSMQQ